MHYLLPYRISIEVLGGLFEQLGGMVQNKCLIVLLKEPQTGGIFLTSHVSVGRKFFP